MGSLFSDFVGDANPDKEEDQPQQPPPQDPLAQQPTQDQIDSLNHAQGVVQQGLQTVTNMFGPQAQQTADQNSINQAQGLVNNAFQGINTVGNAVDQNTARAQAIANQAGGGAVDWYNQNIHNPIQQQVDQNTGPGLLGQLKGLGSGLNYTLGGLGRGLNDVLPSGTPDIVRDVGTNAANLLPWTAAALASGGTSVIPALTTLGGSAVGGVLAPKGANFLEQQGGVPGAIGQTLNTQVVPPWVPVFGGATPANVLGMAGGGAVGEGLPGLFDRGPRPEIPTTQPEAPQPQNFTNAQPSISGTGGFMRENAPAQNPVYYHETSPDTALYMLENGTIPQNGPAGQMGLYLSNSRDLALGQGGKGATVEFDGSKVSAREARPVGQSPEMAQTMGTNFLSQRADPGSVNSVTFQPNSLDRMTAARIRTQESMGTLNVARNEDGSITVQRGPNSIVERQLNQGGTSTTAPTSTTTTSGAQPERSPDQLDAVDAANALRAAGVHPQEQLIGVTPNGTRFEVPPSLMGHVDVMSGEVRDSRLGTGTPMSVFQRIERPDGTVLWDRGGQQPLTTSGGMSPEEEKAYRAGYDLASVPGSNYGRPQYGWPNVGNGAEDNPLSNAHWAGVAQAQAEKMAAAGEPPTPGGFRPPEQGLIAEGTDGTIHNITGFLGARGDGEQFFQTEDGVVPLSQLTNLSAADRAELGQMRTAAGGMPPNTPNAQPVTGQPGSPGAQGFQQSPAGQQFAGQGAAGMNVTQPGVSTSNAAPSTTYGGGAGGITGQAPPAGRPPSGGGTGPSSIPPRPASVPPSLWTHTADLITSPLKLTMAGFHFFRTGVGGLVHPTNLGNAFRGLGLSITDPVAAEAFEKNLRESQPYVAQKLPPGSAIAGRQVQDFQPTPAPLRTGFVTQFINKIPYIGDLLKNTADGNARFLRIIRDSNYNDVAKFISQTVSNADTKFYKDAYDFQNHVTGHSTIPGLRGGGVGTTYGGGVQAIAARLQTDVDMFTKSGSPLPWDAGARAEAVKYWMALGGVITATNALGSALGGSLNLPFNLGSIKAANIINPEGAVASNLFKVTTTNAEKTAKTEYGNDVGQSTMLRYLGGMGLAIYHGDTDAMKSLTTSFMRGEAGPIPGWGLDMLLGTEWRNGSIVPYGPKGGERGMSNLMDDLHAGFISRWANIGVKNLVDSMNAYGPVSGLIRGLPALGAGEVNTSPINTTSQAFKYSAPPDAIQKAFPESPILQKAVTGKDWNELLSSEKSSLTNTLSPQVAQQIHDASAQRNPATTRHSDTVDALVERKNALEDRIREHYLAGELDGPHTVDAMKVVQQDYYRSKDAADKDKEYQAEQAKFKSSGVDETVAQKALDGYYQLPVDKRAEFIRNIGARDPELGVRLANAVQPRNQSKLEVMYANGELR